jgi:hypothetical protein
MISIEKKMARSADLAICRPKLDETFVVPAAIAWTLSLSRVDSLFCSCSESF